MRRRIDDQDVLTIDRDTLARALHRATCDCEEGARSLRDCLLGRDAGWLAESDRLFGLLREDPNVRAGTRQLVPVTRTGLAAGAAARA